MHFRRARGPMNIGESWKRDTSHDDTGVGGDTLHSVNGKFVVRPNHTYRPQLSSLLCDGSGDGGALHFTLGVDNDTGVVLEVQEDTVCSPPRLALADDNSGHDLLPQLGLSLLDGRHDHVASTTSRQTVQARTDTLDGDDVEVTSAGVVAAVHDGSAVFPLASFLMSYVLNGFASREENWRSDRVGCERTQADRGSS